MAGFINSIANGMASLAPTLLAATVPQTTVATLNSLGTEIRLRATQGQRDGAILSQANQALQILRDIEQKEGLPDGSPSTQFIAGLLRDSRTVGDGLGSLETAIRAVTRPRNPELIPFPEAQERLEALSGHSRSPWESPFWQLAAMGGKPRPPKRVTKLSLGKEVRRLREAKGLIQVQLAVKAGASTPQVSQVETGKRIPLASTRRRLEEALGVPVGYLEAFVPRDRRVSLNRPASSKRQTPQEKAARRAHDKRLLGKKRPMTAIGAEIKSQRRNQNITQEQLALKAKTGRPHLTAMEGGKVLPKPPIRRRLETALGLKPGHLDAFVSAKQRVVPGPSIMMQQQLPAILSHLTTELGASSVFVDKTDILTAIVETVSPKHIRDTFSTSSIGDAYSIGQIGDFLHRLKQGKLHGLEGIPERPPTDALRRAVAARLKAPVSAAIQERLQLEYYGKAPDDHLTDPIGILTKLASEWGAACCFVNKRRVKTLTLNKIYFKQFVTALQTKFDDATIDALVEELVTGQLAQSIEADQASPSPAAPAKVKAKVKAKIKTDKADAGVATPPSPQATLSQGGLLLADFKTIGRIKHFQKAVRQVLGRDPQEGDRLWITTGQRGIYKLQTYEATIDGKILIGRDIPADRQGLRSDGGIRISILFQSDRWLIQLSEASGSGKLPFIEQMLTETKWPVVPDNSQASSVRKTKPNIQALKVIKSKQIT